MDLKRESKLLQPDAMEVPAVSSRTVWRAADKEAGKLCSAEAHAKTFGSVKSCYREQVQAAR